jgi:hypothetical protein
LEGNQEVEKRSGRNEPICIAIHKCMEVTLGISLYSKLCPKLAKTIHLSFFIIIYSYVRTLFGPSLFPASSFSPTPLISRQNLIHPVVLQFCWIKNIRDNKKDTAFLLPWDKDSYTERFLPLLPYTSVLQPERVHLYQTSSLLPCNLPIVASVSLTLLFSLLYSGHIKHFHILGFLPFPYSSCTCSPFSMWPKTNNITTFVLGLKQICEGPHMSFGLLTPDNFP